MRHDYYRLSSHVLSVGDRVEFKMDTLAYKLPDGTIAREYEWQPVNVIAVHPRLLVAHVKYALPPVTGAAWDRVR